MADEETTETAPNPDAEELAALRKERADRLAAEQEAKERELAELRAFKAEQEEKAAKAPKAPVKKAEKVAEPEVKTTVEPPKKKVGRGGASRFWFGDADD